MAGNKRDQHMRDIGLCLCVCVRLNLGQIPVCAQANTERKDFEGCCFFFFHTSAQEAVRLQSVCTCLCVWTGYTDHNQHPESRALVPP